MELPTYFKDFVTAISLTRDQRKALQRQHIRLREQLQADRDLRPLLVTTFLQGSYRR